MLTMGHSKVTLYQMSVFSYLKDLTHQKMLKRFRKDSDLTQLKISEYVTFVFILNYKSQQLFDTTQDSSLDIMLGMVFLFQRWFAEVLVD